MITTEKTVPVQFFEIGRKDAKVRREKLRNDDRTIWRFVGLQKASLPQMREVMANVPTDGRVRFRRVDCKVIDGRCEVGKFIAERKDASEPELEPKMRDGRR